MKKIKENFFLYLLVGLIFFMGIYHLILSTQVRVHLVDGMLSIYTARAFLYQISKLVYFTFSLVNFIFIYDMLKRKKLSFFVELALTISALVIAIFKKEVSAFLYIFVLVLFYINRNKFTVKSKGFSLREILILLFTLIGVVFLQSLIIFVTLNKKLNLDLTAVEILLNSLLAIFGETDLDIKFSNRLLYKYQESLFIQTIIVISIFAIGVLKPIFEKRKPLLEFNLEKFVLKYGQNPLSYLTLEEDKEIFYGQNVRGVCGYKIVRNVFVVCGDIICKEENFDEFFEEILEFTKNQHLDLLIFNGTEKFKKNYERYNLKSLKYGEDAVFSLEEYELSGKKAAKVRAAINHANKNGVEVKEYKILEKRDKRIESAFIDISENWIKNKGGVLMEFSVGTLNLNNPIKRRYFYSEQNGEIIGFVVFNPYDNKKGYIADITRRREGATQGAIEKIIYDGFNILKEEGAIYGNMGLCPLYNLEDDGSIEIKILKQFYEKFPNFYDFKSLYKSKNKYGPNSWQNRYVYYNKDANPIKILIAMSLVHFSEKSIKQVFENSILELWKK